MIIFAIGNQLVVIFISLFLPYPIIIIISNMERKQKAMYESPTATAMEVRIENNIMSMGAARDGYGTAEEEDWE